MLSSPKRDCSNSNSIQKNIKISQLGYSNILSATTAQSKHQGEEQGKDLVHKDYPSPFSNQIWYPPYLGCSSV